MWVYKHDLFQREHPELLHMVRRRTCPGNDKRKQRLPRPPKESRSTKVTEADISEGEDQGAEDVSAPAPEPTSQQPVVPENPAVTSSRKRTMTVSDFEKPRVTKRSTPEPSQVVAVDASVLRSLSTAPVLSEESDDQASASTKVDEAEQSAIVSDVASQLAKYARMAQKGTRGRTRRSGSGMVTPPNFKTSTGNLLTYDDECVEDDARNCQRSAEVRSTESSNSGSNDDSPLVKKNMLPDAVPFDVAQAIIKSVVDNTKEHPDRDSLVSSANVSSFCMAVTPAIAAGKDLLCRKILDLFLQSEALAQEFLNYRSALYPLQIDDIRSGFMGPGERQNGGLSTQNVWERADRRSDALREFSVFAVNRIFKVMEFGRETGSLSRDSTILLEQTASVWQKSVWSIE